MASATLGRALKDSAMPAQESYRKNRPCLCVNYLDGTNSDQAACLCRICSFKDARKAGFGVYPALRPFLLAPLSAR
jgi:hypothetical protein